MPFNAIETELPGVLILEPRVFSDARGFFFESFNARDFCTATGIETQFVQDNHSFSTRGVLRGIHYQIQHPQGKLVRVIHGEVFDVAVDLRRSSPTYGRWTGVTLTGENKRQLWVPPGFGHGFLVVSETAEFLYKTTDYWYPEYECTLLWNDDAMAIHWPTATPPVLSAKDAIGTAFSKIQAFA